jgi:SHS2 domain-containing protein
MDYELFEHEADQGIRGYGATAEEAFEHAAEALFEIMCDTSQVEPAEEVSVTVSAPDLNALFIEWLNELLARKDTEDMMFSRFSVKIRQDAKGFSLEGKARGEKTDREKHGLKVEAKAATYSGLKSGEKDGRKFFQCIVDV